MYAHELVRSIWQKKIGRNDDSLPPSLQSYDANAIIEVYNLGSFVVVRINPRGSIIDYIGVSKRMYEDIWSLKTGVSIAADRALSGEAIRSTFHSV